MRHSFSLESLADVPRSAPAGVWRCSRCGLAGMSAPGREPDGVFLMAGPSPGDLLVVADCDAAVLASVLGS